MSPTSYKLPYPRRRLQRGAARIIGRLLLPLFFNLEIIGSDNFPKSGPLVVVANHEAVMESVMMAVLPPWQVELLGAADVPHEKVTDIVTRFFGYIPIRRGRMERNSLEMALDVMRQNGVIGIYPEGGIWDPGAMRAQTGVSWLSYHGKAPVLPIGFGGTSGSLGAALRLKRPTISMRVGKPIQPASPPKGIPRKVYFQEYAAGVMEAVQALIPERQRPRATQIRDERFELVVDVQAADGSPVNFPPALRIQHDRALTKVLHRPGILKIFRSNLELPTEPLERLHEKPDVEQIEIATRSILDYLANDNPYLLTYRFGPKEAENMRLGLEELHSLTHWVSSEGFTLHLTPIRRYYQGDKDDEIVQIKQGRFEDWM